MCASTVEAPFLLENNTNYFTVPGEEMTEPEFLNALTRRSGCGLLLDLHNVYTNARNFGFDPYAFLAELDLTRVGEIHLSGGMELHGFYLDAHDGPCPEALWPMLDWVLARAPNVGRRGVRSIQHQLPRYGRRGVGRRVDQGARDLGEAFACRWLVFRTRWRRW